jgi:hypothetical protein
MCNSHTTGSVVNCTYESAAYRRDYGQNWLQNSINGMSTRGHIRKYVFLKCEYFGFLRLIRAE